MKKSVDMTGDWADYKLQCGVDHHGPWKCEAQVGIYVLKGNVAWTLAKTVCRYF